MTGAYAEQNIPLESVGHFAMQIQINLCCLKAILTAMYFKNNRGDPLFLRFILFHIIR